MVVFRGIFNLIYEKFPGIYLVEAHTKVCGSANEWTITNLAEMTPGLTT